MHIVALTGLQARSPTRADLSQEQIADLPSNVDAYTYAFDNDLNISVEVPEKTDVSVENSDPVQETPVETSFEANTMHYIVGCFGDESNAKNLVAKLKASGLDANIVDVKNGLHRVSAGGAVSIEAFAQIKVAANGLGHTGWTLK